MVVRSIHAYLSTPLSIVTTLAHHNCIGYVIPREVRTHLGQEHHGDRCSVALSPVQRLKRE